MSNLRPIDNIQVSKLTTFEKIALSFKNDSKIKLSKKEREILDRWNSAYTMFRNFESRETISNKLIDLYKISRAQAHRDITNGLNLYGDVNKATKEGMRNVLAEMQMWALKKAYDEQDLDAFNKCMSNLIKIQGLDREDPEMPDFNSFHQHTYNITVNPAEVGLPQYENLESLIAQFKKKKQSALSAEASDAHIVDG